MPEERSPAPLARTWAERPAAGELQLGPAAPVFLPLCFCALLVAWALGGVALVFGSLMLATLICAYLFSLRNLSGLELRARSSELRTVGEDFLLELDVRRRSAAGAAHDLIFASELSGVRDPRPAGILSSLAGKQQQRVPLALKLTERGRLHSLPLRIESSFPFGLVRRVLHYDLPVDLMALPRLGSLGDLGRLEPGQLERSRLRRSARLEEDEFHSLTEWREGMSLRRAHWKLSARRGRILLKAFEDQSEASVQVVLVTAEARGVTAHSRSFESAVSLAATLCEHYMRRGRRVRLAYAGCELHHAPPMQGRGGWMACLESLAEVLSEIGVPSVDLGAVVEASSRRGESVVAVFAGGARPAELLQCPAPALQLDVDDAGIDAVFHRGRAFGATAPLHLSDAS